MSKATTATLSGLLSGKDLTNAIDALGKSAKEMLTTIHHLAASACAEAVRTKNTNAINRLDAACENVGGRALRRWLQKHGPVKWDTEEAKFVLHAATRDTIEEEEGA